MKPILGITMGDAAGIGPELILKAFATDRLYGKCRPLLIGSLAVMELYRDRCHSPLAFRVVQDPAQCACQPGTLDVLDLAGRHAPGIVDVGNEVPGLPIVGDVIFDGQARIKSPWRVGS